MRKLFIRDLFGKPIFSIIITVSVLFAVVLMYCIISYSSVIIDIENGYSFAECGNSEIMISAKSQAGGTLVPTSALESCEGVEDYTGVLEMYATYEVGDSGYQTLYLRGFEKNEIEKLHEIKYIGKLFESSDKMSDDHVIVSNYFAQKNNLSLNSALTVIIGGKTRTVYIAAIAEDTGYFYGNSSMAIASNSYVAAQYGFYIGHVYNKVYVNVENGIEDEMLKTISELPAYQDFEVELCTNQSSTDSITRSYVIGFGLCSVALVVASMLIVHKVFDAQFKAKSLVVSRLKIIGARNSQVAALFFAETATLCLIGIVLGCAVSLLANLIIVKSTTGLIPEVHGINLLISAATVFVVAMLTSAKPIIKAARQSIKECMTDARNTRYKPSKIFAVTTFVLLIPSLIMTFTLPAVMSRAYAALISLILTILFMISIIPYVLRVTGNLLARAKSSNAKLTANVFKYSRNTVSSLQIMAVGVVFCMLALAMLNTFERYLVTMNRNSEDVLYVANVADIGEARLGEFTEIEGAKYVTPVYAVPSEKSIVDGRENKEFNIYGVDSCERLADIFTFDGTDEETVNLTKILNEEGKDYVLISDGIARLREYEVGDEMKIEYNGHTHTYIVGGIVSAAGSTTRCFVRRSTFTEYYDTDTSFNTVFIKADGLSEVADRLRTKFSEDKIEVIPYQSLIAVMSQRNLMSTRFVSIITLFIEIIVAAAVLCNLILGELQNDKESAQLLLLGATKRTLLSRTLLVNVLTGLIFTITALCIGTLTTLEMSSAAVIADAFMIFDFYAADIFTMISIFFAINLITVPLFRTIQPYKVKVDRIKS